MHVFKVGVVGTGVMGAAIAATIERAGFPVVSRDLDGSWDGFGDVDLVIEAVPEVIEIKEAVFAELDAVTPGHAILASNTSSLPISEIANVTIRPDKVIGIHFFYPATKARLVEVVESEHTSDETIHAALNFAAAIRKTAIRSGEAPGFVVNRVLLSGLSAVMRHQYETKLPIAQIDQVLEAARPGTFGPYRLADQLGLDTVRHVAEFLTASYGAERFFVHPDLSKHVLQGDLGKKTGAGFYDYSGGAPAGQGAAASEPWSPGGPSTVRNAPPVLFDPEHPTEPPADNDALLERMKLQMLVEACLILEDGVASMKDIETAMQVGLGFTPPLFSEADRLGLDVVLDRLERAADEWGDTYDPPLILRRLVASGRLGRKRGQGFHAYPNPDAGFEDALVQLESLSGGARGVCAPDGKVAIAWLNNKPANSISPEFAQALKHVHETAAAQGVKALIFASANPNLWSAGADLKKFNAIEDPATFVAAVHALFRSFETSAVITIAAVNAITLGGGNELAMSCDLRIAAESASFGQPEIGLGLIPGFGGTQRLARLVGSAKALELNLAGDPITAGVAHERGLVNALVPDEQLLDYALNWAARLARQPGKAVRLIKSVSAGDDLDAGLKAEQTAFAEVFVSPDGREGVSAFVEKRKPNFSGD
jgi:enoyl-CoA hydratase / 3-hydroxyacyl-CoA dehydrogenase